MNARSIEASVRVPLVLAAAIIATTVTACSVGAERGAGDDLADALADEDAGQRADDSGFASFSPTEPSGGSSNECRTSADCDDRDPCTLDVCEIGGGAEFKTGRCGHAPAASDGGTPEIGPPEITDLPPIRPAPRARRPPVWPPRRGRSARTAASPAAPRAP